MIELTRHGRWFTSEAHADRRGPPFSPILNTSFEDGQLLVHDGHHRVVSKALAECDFLEPA
jgi:hypothetical protein